jgi:hypothetical protein
MILLFHYCSQEARKERRQANKRNREEDVEAIIDNPYINNRVRRWRKCATVADDFAEHLHSLRAGLTVEKKKDVLWRFWEDARIESLLPKFLQDMKGTERKLQLVDNVQQAYIHMDANKSSDNARYRNALLSVVASREDGPS